MKRRKNNFTLTEIFITVIILIAIIVIGFISISNIIKNQNKTIIAQNVYQKVII